MGTIEGYVITYPYSQIKYLSINYVILSRLTILCPMLILLFFILFLL